MKELICARAAVTRAVSLPQHAGGHQRREQRDDRHHHQHLDQRDAGLPSSSSLVHLYTATSLMLVIASSMLRISAPTITPITRITSGSNSAVKRLMAARVSAVVDLRHAREHLVQPAGLLAHGQQVRGQRRKRRRLCASARRCLRRA